MHLISVEQPFIFPGLNSSAIDFLIAHGKWFPYEDADGSTGLIVDKDRFDADNKYNAIVGLYLRNAALVTRTYKVVNLDQIDVEMALYRYKLDDGTWVWERIDQIVADIKPILCLVDEYGQDSFHWTDDEIEEAILFMIEHDLM